MCAPPRFYFVCLAWTLLLGTAPGAAGNLTAAEDVPVVEQPPRLDRYGDPLPELAVARLGTVRLRHRDSVNSVAFSPDGKVLASAGDDHIVFLWDVATGKEIRALSHPSDVRAVLFTPDGKTLVSASNKQDDNRVYLWDVESGKELRFLPMPKPNGLAHMLLSQDGKTLFTSTVTGPVVCWDLPTGREIWRTEEKDEWSKCLALAPDRKTLVTGGERGSVCFRDAQSGKTVQSLPTSVGDAFHDILSVAFSPDGQILAVTDERGDLKFWNVSTSKCTQQLHVGTSILAPLAFSPDGKTLACGMEQTVHLYDPATGKEVAQLEGHMSWVRSVTFSKDGRYLASAGQDQTIRVWNLATLKPLHSFASNPGGSCSALFLTDGHRLLSSNWTSGYGYDYRASTNRKDPCVRQTWNSQSVETLRESKPEACVSGPGCLSPDGKIFACSGADGLVRLVDAKSGKDLRTVGKKGEGFNAKPMAFSRDGRAVAVVSNELGPVRTHGWESLERLRLWDVDTGQLVATAIEDKQLNWVGGVQFSRKGQLLTAVEGRGLREGSSIHLWRLDKGNSLGRLTLPEPLVEAHPVFSPDGRRLITTVTERPTEDREGEKWKQAIRIRELVNGKAILCLKGQSGVCCCALSPDNRLLALGDEEGCVRLVEVLSEKEVKRLRGHRGSIASLEFSPDGTLLISGSGDTTALVWDLRLCAQAQNIGQAERLNEALWAGLADEEASKAFQAVQALLASPEKGIALLKSRLRPLPPLDLSATEKLIADLDSDEFEVRQRATRTLSSLERTAIPLLQKTLKTTHSPEVRLRVKQLLSDAENPGNSPERLRDLRAIHCLRSIGTESAQQLLQTLAKGTPEARLTQEAREALESLK